MKVVIAIILLGAVFIAPPGEVAEAQATPHVVIEREAWLMDAEGNKLFLLPASYYARINNLDENYYYVTFNGISGKVNKSEVNTIGYHAAASGTMREIRVSDSFSEFTAINLKGRANLGAENVVAVPSGEAVVFLGCYPTDEELWYYVKYEQYLGYIRAERTTMPEPMISEFVPEAPPEEEAAIAPETPEEGAAPLLESRELKIIIVIGLTIPAVALVILLFKAKNKEE